MNQSSTSRQRENLISEFRLHIVPRTPGDSSIVDYEPRKFLYRPGSRAVSPNEELLGVVRAIQEVL